MLVVTQKCFNQPCGAQLFGKLVAFKKRNGPLSLPKAAHDEIRVSNCHSVLCEGVRKACSPERELRGAVLDAGPEFFHECGGPYPAMLSRAGRIDGSRPSGTPAEHLRR